MSPREVNRAWYASPYTGLFAESGPVPPEPYDPDVSIWGGTAPLPGPGGEPPASGGAGWDEASAEAAGVGEAIERWQTWPLPGDRYIEACFADWPLDEPAIAPERWVLYHADQYALPGFPYMPFTKSTECRWLCFRQAFSGFPFWVPEELTYLALPPGRFAQLCSLVSSGMTGGQWGQPVLLRGLQEAIERDAVVGAGWGRYLLTEYEPERVFAGLDPALRPRLLRPNLRYRFYHVGSPFSAHVTVVTLEGEDREGYCFSVGSACRETRMASWVKSLLEAVQGRPYVRYLKGRLRQENRRIDVPASFADHAVYYSFYPERLSATVLGHSASGATDVEVDRAEGMSELVERLGADRPVLFRNLTPPGIAMEKMEWCVLRVLVPGLQPLHGHHALPFLGGPLWAPRGWKDWLTMPPHPFP
jgi:thiazole/oxazole-forming peptide maturase SagD family component